MRNGFSQNDAPPGLVNLPYGMCDELFDLEFGCQMLNAASTATRRGLAQRLLGLVQVGLGFGLLVDGADNDLV
jgi:hypothetical protein